MTARVFIPKLFVLISNMKEAIKNLFGNSFLYLINHKSSLIKFRKIFLDSLNWPKKLAPVRPIHDFCAYHIKTSQMLRIVNQVIGFYMKGKLVYYSLIRICERTR